MDDEIVKLQTELISEKEFTKLQNQFENEYVDKTTACWVLPKIWPMVIPSSKNTNEINTRTGRTA